MRRLAMLLFCCACLASRAAADAGAKRFHELDDRQIASELKLIHEKNPGLEERVVAVSERFLGTPYRLGPLGEGHDGEFDRDPLVSFKEADCTTFIEQVMALSLESELSEALKTLQRIRYKDGRVGFATRNHFAEVDWIAQNAWAGFLRDVTQDVAGERTRRISKVISKRLWYAQMSTASLHGVPEPEKAKRLPALQALGLQFEDQRAALAYMPLDILPRELPRIPSGTIANLVREDQPDKPVLISHQVLLIDKQGVKYVRHAAAGGAVEDVPALEYFYRYFNSRWRLVGLNLNAIRGPAARP